MLLALTLFLGGCTSVNSQLKASVNQTPNGNATRMQLPEGSWIVFSAPENATKFLQAFAGQAHAGASKTTVILDEAVYAVTGAWVTERNQQILNLSQALEKAKAK